MPARCAPCCATSHRADPPHGRAVAPPRRAPRGAVQTRAEYLSHHLGADMKASNGSKAVRSIVQVQLMGEAAYVVSKSVTPPTGAEGATGSEMAELMVLSKTPSGWSIRAVHWSSRRKRS